MKICHCISSIDKNSGGTSTYLQSLANELVKHIEISISTVSSNNPLPINDKVPVLMSKSTNLWTKYYSFDTIRMLIQIEPDLFHGNGLWEYPVHAMANTAYKRNIPYVISPHGMLEPWSLNVRKFKKQLALYFYQYHDLNNAGCIHTTAEMEAENIRRLGLKNPIAVIPNGIELSEYTLKTSAQEPGKRTILFLSRVHPKKGIELLIEAWDQLDKTARQNWQVHIAGNGEESYLKMLQQQIDSKGLGQEIHLIGPLFGADKIKEYHSADLFVLPTYSENFGIVIAEALACGVPVITTTGTPWKELNTSNAGWCIEIGVKSLAATLQKAMQLDYLERQLLGQNGRRLIEKNYSIESVAGKMIQLYNWILKKGERPEYVYL